MNLRDLIYKKNLLDIKIQELRNILNKLPQDDVAKELVVLLDERQQVVLNIKNANSQCYLTIGSNKFDLNSAVIIRDSIQRKVDILTELINSESDHSLDRMQLIEQRDKFMEDFTLLDMNIVNMDINTRIG